MEPTGTGPTETMPQPDYLTPSAQFRSGVIRVTFSIIVFVLVYFILVLFSVALLVACVALGMGVISANPGFLTLAIGLGFLGLGIMIVVFMVKFIFSKTRNTDPGRIEITADEHPALFAFVYDVARQAGTPTPKRIFVSPEVNAAVFYDSSFLSMFLPVKKNLVIGLGLVNAVEMSEFKAIIAHEFGHFSQKSMQLGSYVYTTNRVIYNLLYDNSGWESALNSFGRLHSILMVFAKLTSIIADFIKQILIKVYGWIQLRYMALSREMEYHADLIAVSISGSNQMISSLRRIEFASVAYDAMLAQLQQLSAKSARCADIFELQHKTLIYLSEANKLNLRNDLPVITDEELEKRKSLSRIVVKDQWASHPTRQEREDNINRYPVQVADNHDSPWTLFNQPEALKKRVTNHLYKLGFPQKTDFLNMTADDIVQKMERERKAAALPERFDGFYQWRILADIDLPTLLNKEEVATGTFQSIYTPVFKANVAKLVADVTDKTILEQIKSKSRPLKSFDFDGKKYRQSDAAKIVAGLDVELAQVRSEIRKSDIEALKFYLQRAEAKGSAGNFKGILEFHLVIQDFAYDFTEMINRMNDIYARVQAKPLDHWGQQPLLAFSREVDEQRELYQNLLAKSEGIAVRGIPPESPIPDLRKHLLKEKIADAYLAGFNYNLVAQLYQQMLASSTKVNVIWQASYRELLGAMDNLSGE